MQASFVSPEKLASRINQFNKGGTQKISNIIILILKAALKLFVLIFLFNLSKIFIPEFSILIKCKPKVPNNNGVKKLKNFGKKPVRFIWFRMG